MVTKVYTQYLLEKHLPRVDDDEDDGEDDTDEYDIEEKKISGFTGEEGLLFLLL